MWHPRSVRVIAIVLVLIAGLAVLLGWDLVSERQILTPHPKQSTRANRRIQLPDFGDHPQVETYDYNATLQLVMSDEFDHCRSDFIVLFSRSTGFQFDIDRQLFVWLISEQPEHVFERGNRLPCVFQTREHPMTLIEPTTDVDLLQLVIGHACDPSFAQPCVRHSRIMNHHGHSVSRESHV